MVFYLGVHLLLYFSTVYFFSITEPATKNLLLAILIFMSLSFIISAMLAKSSDAILVKTYYTISAFWLGWLVYLFLSLIIAWILVYILNFFNVEAKMLIGVLVFVLPLLLCSYGYWQTNHPVIKKIKVKIKDLPASWQGKTVVQLSDLHLGDINGLDFAEKIVKQVNSLNPYAVFITGDLFDGMDGIHDVFISTIEKLSAIQGVYFITGNHETYLGSERIIADLRKSKIKVLDNEFVTVDGVQIIGLSYPEPGKRVVKEDIVGSFSNYNPLSATILLYHEPVSIDQRNINKSNQAVKSYWHPNTDFSAQKDKGVNLQLSGHTHKGQFFPFDLFTKKIYNGYDYGLFTEEDFNLYVTSGTGTWGPPIRIGNKSEIVAITLN